MSNEELVVRMIVVIVAFLLGMVTQRQIFDKRYKNTLDQMIKRSHEREEELNSLKKQAQRAQQMVTTFFETEEINTIH